MLLLADFVNVRRYKTYCYSLYLYIILLRFDHLSNHSGRLYSFIYFATFSNTAAFSSGKTRTLLISSFSNSEGYIADISSLKNSASVTPRQESSFSKVIIVGWLSPRSILWIWFCDIPVSFESR